MYISCSSKRIKTRGVRQNCSAYPAPHLHGTFVVWSKIEALLCLKRHPYGLRMNEESSPALMGLCYSSQGPPRINPSRLTTNAAKLFIPIRSCETWHEY